MNASKYELVGSIDASPGTITQRVDQTDLADLIRQLIIAQNRQNDLLQMISNQLSAAQRQRALELAQWKRQNPQLARSCKAAAERVSRFQTETLSSLVDDLEDNFEDFEDNEYVLSDFFDKYGPKIMYMNTVLQTLTTLGNAPEIVGPTPNV